MLAFKKKIESTHRKLFPSGAGVHAKASSMDFNISIAAMEIIKGFFGGEPVLGVSAAASIDALLTVLKRIKVCILSMLYSLTYLQTLKASRPNLGQLNEHFMQLYNDVLEPVYYYQLHKDDQLLRDGVQSLFELVLVIRGFLHFHFAIPVI